MTQKQFVQSQREFTIKLLEKLKPDQWSAATLCAGWSVEDLAAHLVCRERSIIGGIGLVLPALQNLHDLRIKKLETKGRKYIVEKLQRYPWYMPASLNTAEFWVHNEDFLRGELKMNRKKPSNEENAILWSSLKGLAKIRKTLLRDMGNLELVNTENNEAIKINFSNTKNKTIIKGTAGELLLFFYGRRKAAKVKAG